MDLRTLQPGPVCPDLFYSTIVLFVFFLLTGAVVIVGFELMKYTVSERIGEVSVCLVTSSVISSDLSFYISTEQRSARGKLIIV